MVLRPCLVTGTERALEPDHLWEAPVGSCLCLQQRGVHSVALVFIGGDLSGTVPIARGSTSVCHWMTRPLRPSQRAPQLLGESLEVRGSSSEATTVHSLPTSPLRPVFPCCPLPSCWMRLKLFGWDTVVRNIELAHAALGPWGLEGLCHFLFLFKKEKKNHSNDPSFPYSLILNN